MKLDEFNLWLKGFLAALGSNPLSKQHFDILKEKINSVEFPFVIPTSPLEYFPQPSQIDWEKMIQEKQKKEEKDIWPIRPYEGPTYYPYPKINPLTPNEDYVRPLIGDPVWCQYTSTGDPIPFSPQTVCKGEN